MLSLLALLGIWLTIHSVLDGADVAAKSASLPATMMSACPTNTETSTSMTCHTHAVLSISAVVGICIGAAVGGMCIGIVSYMLAQKIRHRHGRSTSNSLSEADRSFAALPPLTSRVEFPRHSTDYTRTSVPPLPANPFLKRRHDAGRDITERGPSTPPTSSNYTSSLDARSESIPPTFSGNRAELKAGRSDARNRLRELISLVEVSLRTNSKPSAPS